MSNKGLVLRQNISNIANTIRKNSTIQTTYKPRELSTAIQTVIDKYKNNNPTNTVTDGTCSNALDVPVKNYKIYGNSTQNIEPNPDSPQEIYSVGDLVESGEYAGKYKIPVKVSGKNLLNITKVKPYIYSSGSPFNNATDFTISSFSSNSLSFSSQVNGYRFALLDTIKLEPNTTYTISYTRTNSLTQGAFARRWLYNWNEIDGYTMLFALNDSDSGNMSHTFTTDSYGYLGIAFGFNNNASGSSSVVSNIQIEKGSATDFEPYQEPITTNIYLDEPLRGIGTVKDLITYLTQKRTNNIKKVTLSAGTYTLSDAKNDGNYMCIQQES